MTTSIKADVGGESPAEEFASQVQLASELETYEQFVSKVKRRDAIIFWLAFVALLVGFGAGGITLFRGFSAVDERFRAMDEKLNQYQTQINMAQETLHAVNDTEVHSLIESVAQHRKEIDQLKAEIKCLKKPSNDCK